MAVLESTLARKLLPGGASTAQTVADGAGLGLGLGFDLGLTGVVRFLCVLWELILAKAAELADLLSRKADELFPPETRPETLRRWVHVAVTVVLPAALGALALFCLARCCCRCCCRRASRGRMMAAPGRRGARMPRDAFEVDPRRYFRDLRARKDLIY